MDLNLKNKYAIVCGSTQGIGLAIAQKLASEGTNVLLVARNEGKLKAALNSLDARNNQQHNFLVADFSAPEQLNEAITSYLKSHPQVDILVNNTGGPPPGKAIDASTDNFLSAFNQHLICNHLLVQAVFPVMKKKGFGRIVNIISTSVKAPIPGLGVSNTIRGAVASWSKTLSLELAEFGITVNNILPGATETGRLESLIESKAKKLSKTVYEVEQEMKGSIPSGRFAKPEELASAVAFLCSEAAGYINGVNLAVDGGKTVCL